MTKAQDKRSKSLLVVFTILSLVIIVFFASTDTFQLFSVTSLSFDATGKRGNLIERGANGFSGQFTKESKIYKKIDRFENKIEQFNEKIDNLELKLETPKADKKPQFRDRVTNKIERFEDRIDRFEDKIDRLKDRLDRGLPREPTPTLPPDREPPNVEILPLPTDIEVVNINPQQKIVVVRNVPVSQGNVEEPSSGIASSTVGLSGFQELIREKVIVHDSFHTPANGQTTTGTLLIEWGHPRSITISQFLVPNEYFEWFEVEIPQRLTGEGLVSNFDGVNQDEFKYRITIPEDLIDQNVVIPVRLIINSEVTPLEGLAEIQIERPEPESTTFSIAEWIRSFLAELRS